MAAPRLHVGYVKNRTHGSESILVTINYLWLKCYLSFCLFVEANIKKFKIVADGMRSFNALANAINKLYSFLEKNINENVYSFLSTLTTNSSSSASIVQSSVSFTDRSNALTISEGIVVLSDFECDACRFAVDSTSNNFIPPFMLFFINIYDNIL